MRKTQEKVPLPEARMRALQFMQKNGGIGRLYGASQIGCAIWPTATFRAQGAGLAGVRILKLLEADGLVRYVIHEVAGSKFWGWTLTSAGLRHLEKNIDQFLFNKPNKHLERRP